MSHRRRRATQCGARRNATSLGLTLGLAVAASTLTAAPARTAATVFHSRDEALRIAFPDADRVEPRDFFLTAEQRQEIEGRAQVAARNPIW